MIMKNHIYQKEIDEAYELLGLQPWVTEAEIKKAWRKRIQSAHPDNNDWIDHELAAKLNVAKDRLINVVKWRVDVILDSNAHTSSSGANDTRHHKNPMEEELRKMKEDSILYDALQAKISQYTSTYTVENGRMRYPEKIKEIIDVYLTLFQTEVYKNNAERLKYIYFPDDAPESSQTFSSTKEAIGSMKSRPTVNAARYIAENGNLVAIHTALATINGNYKPREVVEVLLPSIHSKSYDSRSSLNFLRYTIDIRLSQEGSLEHISGYIWTHGDLKDIMEACTILGGYNKAPLIFLLAAIAWKVYTSDAVKIFKFLMEQRVYEDSLKVQLAMYIKTKWSRNDITEIRNSITSNIGVDKVLKDLLQ